MWAVTANPGRWKLSGSALTIYADFTNGSDTNDGLAPGAGNAFKSIEGAETTALNSFDFNGSTVGSNQIIIQLAAQTADTQGVHWATHSLVGAQGGAALVIQGATLPVTGAANNGSGLVRLTMASTASYTTGNSVSVRNVVGTTEANGVWKITVIDATHIDLQGSVFASAYVSGGQVSNGSVISTTGVDAITTYFGSVLQLLDVTLQSNINNLDVLWGSKVYIAGVIFGGTPVGAHINLGGFGQVEFLGPNGFSGNAANGIVGNVGNLRTQGQKLSITNNITFSSAFVLLIASGTHVYFQGTTIALQGNTVTGQRFNVGNGATLNSGLLDGNLTYFPGSTVGSILSGGQYDSLVSGSQLVGTATNDNASAGNIGEDVGSTIVAGSAVALTTGTSANVTTISLTAGDWDVFGTIEFKGGATTTINYVQGGSTSTSASLSEPSLFTLYQGGVTPFGTITFIAFPIPTQRFSLSTTTTIYLVATAGFGVSTCSAYGRIEARRRR